MSNELLQAIGRLRRAQPKNPDTNMVCDALEKWLIIQHQKELMLSTMPEHSVCAERFKEKFDRRTYQREFMRKQRAKAKEEWLAGAQQNIRQR